MSELNIHLKNKLTEKFNEEYDRYWNPNKLWSENEYKKLFSDKKSLLQKVKRCRVKKKKT